MTSRENPSTRTRRRRILVRSAAATAALAAVVTVSVTTAAPAKDETPASEVHEYSPAFQAAVARYAQAHGLSGLSPVSIRPIGPGPTDGCRGLSPASATGCSSDELERALSGTP